MAFPLIRYGEKGIVLTAECGRVGLKNALSYSRLFADVKRFLPFWQII